MQSNVNKEEKARKVNSCNILKPVTPTAIYNSSGVFNGM